MGNLISVSINKGGAGKTTISTNLAVNLAKRFPNKKICLLDLDGQCGVSIIFGKSPKKYAGSSILSVLREEKNLSDVLDNEILDPSTKEAIDNLYVIYSEKDMNVFDHVVNDDLTIRDNLVEVLKFLKEKFDYVIVDTPPAMSTINAVVFLVADVIVSPFEPERQNIEGLWSIVEQVEKDIYKNKPYIYMVPWKVRERTLIDRDLMQYVEDIVNIEYKDNEKIIISDIRVPVSTQYKSTSAKEKAPLIASKSKSKAVAVQKENIDKITNDILDLLK